MSVEFEIRFLEMEQRIRNSIQDSYMKAMEEWNNKYAKYEQDTSIPGE